MGRVVEMSVGEALDVLQRESRSASALEDASGAPVQYAMSHEDAIVLYVALSVVKQYCETVLPYLAEFAPP